MVGQMTLMSLNLRMSSVSRFYHLRVERRMMSFGVRAVLDRCPGRRPNSKAARQRLHVWKFWVALFVVDAQQLHLPGLHMGQDDDFVHQLHEPGSGSLIVALPR